MITLQPSQKVKKFLWPSKPKLVDQWHDHIFKNPCFPKTRGLSRLIKNAPSFSRERKKIPAQSLTKKGAVIPSSSRWHWVSVLLSRILLHKILQLFTFISNAFFPPAVQMPFPGSFHRSTFYWHEVPQTLKLRINMEQETSLGVFNWNQLMTNQGESLVSDLSLRVLAMLLAHTEKPNSPAPMKVQHAWFWMSWFHWDFFTYLFSYKFSWMHI